MNHFLVFQHTYNGVQVALFDDQQLVQITTENKKQASKNIVALADEMLRVNNVSFRDLSFIAANQGPGPFTTLRVIIATVNGLAFATQKSLIGVDGLDALLSEYRNESYPITVALLNAYGGDVYFGVEILRNTKREKGYQHIASLLSHLNSSFPTQTIRFIGQAVSMHTQLIDQTFGDRAFIPAPLPEHCSTKQVGKMALHSRTKQEGLTNQLLPLYLKSMTIKKQAPTNF